MNGDDNGDDEDGEDAPVDPAIRAAISHAYRPSRQQLDDLFRQVEESHQATVSAFDDVHMSMEHENKKRFAEKSVEDLNDEEEEEHPPFEGPDFSGVPPLPSADDDEL